MGKKNSNLEVLAEDIGRLLENEFHCSRMNSKTRKSLLRTIAKNMVKVRECEHDYEDIFEGLSEIEKTIRMDALVKSYFKDNSVGKDYKVKLAQMMIAYCFKDMK